MDFAMPNLLISSSDLEYLRALSRAWFDGLDSGILLEKERSNNVPRLQPEEIEQQLNEAPQGQFERENKGAKLASVKKSYTPIPIPDKT